MKIFLLLSLFFNVVLLSKAQASTFPKSCLIEPLTTQAFANKEIVPREQINSYLANNSVNTVIRIWLYEDSGKKSVISFISSHQLGNRAAIDAIETFERTGICHYLNNINSSL